MIGIAKQAINKATKEMMKEASKKAGKYVVRTAIIGGVAIGGNYVAYKVKEKGKELTKDIEKSVKNGSQDIADTIQGNKKPEPIKTSVKIVKKVSKATLTVVGTGACVLVAAKMTGYVKEAGKDMTEELAADYRKIKYFVEEDEINTIDDEIEYL